MSGALTTGFTINNGTGFTLKFENGWSVSVQFNWYNYCEAAERVGVARDFKSKGPHTSATAEVAVIKPEGGFFPIKCHDVLGHLTPDQVARIIAFVSACPAMVELALDP